MSSHLSLSESLDGWFDADLAHLPEALRARVSMAFALFDWHQLAPHQRRAVAAQWDEQNDPAGEHARELEWQLIAEVQDRERRIEHLRAVGATAPRDIRANERQLAKLGKERADASARLEASQRTRPTTAADVRQGQSSDAAQQYIAYPRAFERLRERLHAEPAELAAWVFLGPGLHGLAAYLQANDVAPPPRFVFEDLLSRAGGEAHDYLSPLMSCWFSEADVECFQPTRRYLLGRDLLASWSTVPGIEAYGFVLAKIRERRLQDLHPVYGCTRGTHPDDPSYPPLECALFCTAEIEAIEREDFGRQVTCHGKGAEPKAVASVAMVHRAAWAKGWNALDPVGKARLVLERKAQLKRDKVKPWQKTIASELGVSTTRVKEILGYLKKPSPFPTAVIAPSLKRS